MSTELKIGVVVGILLVAALIVFLAGRTYQQTTPPETPEQTQTPETTAPLEPQPVKPTPPPSPPQPTENVLELPEQTPDEDTTAPSEPIDVIDLPSKTPQQSPVAPPAQPPAPTPEPPVAVEPAPEEPPADTSLEPRYHTVQKGESLSQIARLYYGEARHWRIIYQANRDIIKDPHNLKPDWELRIPYPSEIAPADD